jgi:hypothetical protein
MKRPTALQQLPRCHRHPTKRCPGECQYILSADECIIDLGLTMTEDEIAFRAAINELRDSIELGRMPSGIALAPDVANLHERAVARLETRLAEIVEKATDA